MAQQNDRENRPITLGLTGALDDREAITYLKQAIASGQHWYLALLEAIGLWASPEEDYNGLHYRYLISNEAFDWLLLAERLCQEVDGLIPEDELLDLLLLGKPPLEVSDEDFKKLIGDTKHRAYLNYFYGVTVEQSLLLAVEQEIFKERQANIFCRTDPEFEDSYRRLYGESQPNLLRRFRKEMGHPYSKSMTLSEVNKFTYWLFRYRLGQYDKARVASDTKKGLEYLKKQQLTREEPKSTASA